MPFSNMSPNSPSKGVVAEADLHAANLVDDDLAASAGVVGDLADRVLEGPANDVDADLGVGVLELELVENRLAVQKGCAATGDHALLDAGPNRGQGVLDAVLLLLELDLGGRADLDDGHAAGQLGQALLELLAVVVRGGLLDLGLDLASSGP